MINALSAGIDPVDVVYHATAQYQKPTLYFSIPAGKYIAEDKDYISRLGKQLEYYIRTRAGTNGELLVNLRGNVEVDYYYVCPTCGTNTELVDQCFDCQCDCVPVKITGPKKVTINDGIEIPKTNARNTAIAIVNRIEQWLDALDINYQEWNQYIDILTCTAGALAEHNDLRRSLWESAMKQELQAL